MEGKEERIRVAVRVRPLSGVHIGKEEAVKASADGQSVLVYSDSTRSNAATFRCGTFLPSDITQQDVFEEIRAPELIEAALDGYPVTIFAYGQTGAGKSFTIFGKEDTQTRLSGNGVVADMDGVLPRTAHRLMEIVDERRGLVDYTLRVTCVEIYNEQVRDLFDAKKEPLAVRHSKDHGFYLENATVVECQSAKEISKVVRLAATNRIKSAHLLNERSNRSHCLVTIYIDAMPRDGVKKYGKLTIVDLAGSERANDTGAVGQQLKETGHINKSLYCLSKVIQTMTTNSNNNGKPKFVPFRDSKLTMLLIDSLGGNCKTLMLACVNSAPQFATESTRTLEFAMGVARIKNRPTAVLNPHEKLISDLKEQIRLLKLENMMLRSRTPGYFLEHPERLEGYEVDGRLKVESFATSSLGKALLSGRLRPDDLHSRERSANREGNNKAAHESWGSADLVDTMTQQRGATTERHAMPAGVSEIKKMVSMKRRSGISKRKDKPPSQKAKKKKSPRPANIESTLASFTLPPVKQPKALLFQKRHADSSLPTAPEPRPSTPPPDYDDLFGIETVPVNASDLSNQLCSERSTRGHIRLTHSHSKIEQPEDTSTPGSAEHLQELLRGILPASETMTLASRSQSVSQLRRDNQSSVCVSGQSGAPQFDDMRAQELFQQLCRL